MRPIKQTNMIHAKNLAIVVIALAIVAVIEPTAGNRAAFAIPYSMDPTAAYSRTYHPYGSPDVIEQQARIPRGRKTHAPEPVTFLTILGGVAGFILRFIRKSFERTKRFFDIVFSVIGLLVSLPILLLTVIAIKLTSRGPVIYRQRRVGKDGGVFQIYKLRSMFIDAEKGTGAVWAKKNDSRITSIGRIMRKTHLDEVPQFINVFKGEMSIVGPRPERPELVKDFQRLIDGYGKRLEVKPGITGLAQVFHRYDETLEDVRIKVKFDSEYVSSRSLRVDLEILARTCVVVTTGKGAH